MVQYSAYNNNVLEVMFQVQFIIQILILFTGILSQVQGICENIYSFQPV